MRYFYDLHIHTSRYSADSRIRAEEALRMAQWRGLNGVVFTEHDHLWAPDDIEALKEQAQCPNLTVLSGCETRTQKEGCITGDLLLYGVETIPEEPVTIDEACRLAHSQGGVVVAAHPMVPLYGIGDDIHSADIDGLEIGNSRHFSRSGYRRLARVCEARNLAGLANSDAHTLGDIGAFCIKTNHPIRSNADLVSVIRLNQSRPRLKKPVTPILQFLRAFFSRSKSQTFS